MNTTKMLENVRCEKDLGVLTNHKLNFDLHIAEKKGEFNACYYQKMFHEIELPVTECTN